jgi:hypothetical protein
VNLGHGQLQRHVLGCLDTWPVTTIPWLTMIYGVLHDVADTPQLRSSMRRAVARLQLDGLVRATRLLLASRAYSDEITITRAVLVICRPAASLVDQIPLIRFQEDVVTASRRLG